MSTPGKAHDTGPLRNAKAGMDNYLRYTGLGFTMIGIVLVPTLLGWWMDGRIGWKYPILTVVFSLMGIAGAMVYLFKETARKP